MTHSSYLEYFLDLKSTFQSGYEGVQPEKEMDKDFEKTFLSLLMETTKRAWSDYELLIRETYLLSESELEKVWSDTTMESTNTMVEKLSNLGYITTGVNANGDIVYSISEDGREYIESIAGK
jgi:hypothetical protein